MLVQRSSTAIDPSGRNRSSLWNDRAESVRVVSESCSTSLGEEREEMYRFLEHSRMLSTISLEFQHSAGPLSISRLTFAPKSDVVYISVM